MKNKLDDLKPQSNKLWGIYRGVVECRYDPLFAGRIKVRVWGVHTQYRLKDEETGIPIEELPWAQPVNGIFQGSVSGYGASVVPILGSHVLLFFENGDPMQPRYFGTTPAIPEKHDDPVLGFTDPCGTYPKAERLEEPDFHRLAREEKKETCIEWREWYQHKNIQTATIIDSVTVNQSCDTIVGPTSPNKSDDKDPNEPPECIEREPCEGGKDECPDNFGGWKGI